MSYLSGLPASTCHRSTRPHHSCTTRRAPNPKHQYPFSFPVLHVWLPASTCHGSTPFITHWKVIFLHLRHSSCVSINAVEAFPVHHHVRLLFRPHQHPLLQVVEAYWLVRTLPAKVKAPANVIRHIGQAEKKRKWVNGGWEGLGGGYDYFSFRTTSALISWKCKSKEIAQRSISHRCQRFFTRKVNTLVIHNSSYSQSEPQSITSGYFFQAFLWSWKWITAT